MTLDRHSARVGLPDIIEALMPELASIALPVEKLATCSTCAMVAGPDEDPESTRFFSNDTRCCTYHPSLPNFYVGRALRRGGRGAEVVRERLALDDGLHVTGINPNSAWAARNDLSTAIEDGWDRQGAPVRPGEKQWLHRHNYLSYWGRDRELLCPFFVGGEHTCGIWQDRGAVCRSWHCRHVDGPNGFRFWRRVQDTFVEVERALAQAAVEKLGAVTPVGVPEWEAWFVRCAEWLDGVTVTDVPAIVRHVEGFRARIRYAAEGLGRDLPDLLVPAVIDIEHEGGRVRLVGFSYFDYVTVPTRIFEVLSRLDGNTDWREVLAEVDGVDEEMLRGLFRVGAIADSRERRGPDWPLDD